MSINDLITLAKGSAKYCIGFEGNISGKVGDNLYIKASGTNLHNLKYDELVAFDFKGKQLTRLDKKGSMELSFHIFLLNREGINYISHTHPINTLKILCSSDSEKFANKRIFPDQVIFNGGKSCLVPYAKPGQELTDIIRINVDEFIIEEGYFPKLILLQNHGIIACGKTINECLMITDICEKSAEIFNGINKNKITYLTDEQVTDLLSDEKEKYRKSLL